MTAEELVTLLESGDLFALAVRVNQELLAKHYPHMRHAILVGYLERGAPRLMVPIVNPCETSSSPPLEPLPESFASAR